MHRGGSTPEPHARESPLFMRFQVKNLARAPRFFPQDSPVLRGDLYT